ncbi:hypothetical protein GE09DRAFT_1101339 [Coniochaeta sp. 2T2.1]|nr:hypothetical protein GE09DRAFT_1101339 [Coniochaeta sp. 2T2.1]
MIGSLPLLPPSAASYSHFHSLITRLEKEDTSETVTQLSNKSNLQHVMAVTISSIDPDTKPASSCAFFEVLPPELRRHILIHAFGNRTLHVRQLGTVCRRLELQPAGVNPASDDCVREYHSLRMLKSDWNIGALSWLLTCRLAYVEGVEVLYATNTLHVCTSGVGSHQIPITEHLSHRQLNLIISLEWVIKPRFLSEIDGGASGRLAEFLQAMPEVLPNLQRLYIGFRAGGVFLGRK